MIHSGLHQTFNGLQSIAVDPRLGFTFSPSNHSNMVVRGGFGIFTDIFPPPLPTTCSAILRSA